MTPTTVDDFGGMVFAAMPGELDDATPTIELVWQTRPLEWTTVWTTTFPSISDRDITYEAIWDRQLRWHTWGLIAVFAGTRALNRILLEEVAT